MDNLMKDNKDFIRNKILYYTKEKLKITKMMMDGDDGLDYGHSQFLSGLYNAYDDITFEIENGSLMEE